MLDNSHPEEVPVEVPIPIVESPVLDPEESLALELELEHMVYPLIAEEPKEIMHLYILGKSPAWQDKNGACSGYLVQTYLSNSDLDTSGHRPPGNILIDCGSGIVSQVQNYIQPADIDVVFISHLHADHYFDLVPLAYLLKYSPYPHGRSNSSLEEDSKKERERENRPQPILYAPKGGREVFRNLGSLWESPNVIEDSFTIIEYSLPGEIDLGHRIQFKITSVPHLIETAAVDITALNADGSKSRFTYGADCGSNDNLIEIAQNTPLLIAEATMPEDQISPDGSPCFHMSAHQAGKLAAEANVQRLVLTHYSERYSSEWMRDEVLRSGFNGQIHLAAPGETFSNSLLIKLYE